VDGGYYNSARLIDEKGVSALSYTKRRLVPFGEFVPFGNTVFNPLQSLIMHGNEGFIKAGKITLLPSIWGNIGVSICSEILYPRLVSQEVRKGASLIVSIANLAWFHNSCLNKQVLASAQFRACENGRYIVLASNSGISAVIDPRGIISSLSVPGRKGVLLDKVQFFFKDTPFTKMWWL
jgi:apolipoprotein N-acyltransferase